jgi:hypothetical protein
MASPSPVNADQTLSTADVIVVPSQGSTLTNQQVLAALSKDLNCKQKLPVRFFYPDGVAHLPEWQQAIKRCVDPCVMKIQGTRVDAFAWLPPTTQHFEGTTANPKPTGSWPQMDMLQFVKLSGYTDTCNLDEQAPNLETLSIVGGVPASLKFSNLKTLVVLTDQISNSLLDGLHMHTPKLETLELNLSSFDGTEAAINSTLERLQRLKVVCDTPVAIRAPLAALKKVEVIGCVLRVAAACPQLARISIQSIGIPPDWGEWDTFLPNLNVLDVMVGNTRDILRVSAKGLPPSLTELSLWYMKLDMTFKLHLPNLHTFRSHGWWPAPSEIAQLPASIQVIDAADCLVRTDGLAAAVPNLVTFHARNSRYLPGSYISLCDLPASTRNVTLMYYTINTENCRAPIQHLSLSYVDGLYEGNRFRLYKLPPSVVHLSVYKCDVQFCIMGGRFSDLKTFRYQPKEGETPLDLTDIPPGVETLDISGRTIGTFRHFTHLRTLQVDSLQATQLPTLPSTVEMVGIGFNRLDQRIGKALFPNYKSY